jgi:hypothetical protein
LFQLPDSPQGKLVAYLINKPELTGGLAVSSKPQQGHGRHEHDHSAEIQILSGEGEGHDPRPVLLEPNLNVDLVVTTGNKGVTTAPSFDRHVPDCETIMANGIGAIKNVVRGTPNTKLIQNVVTVDAGVAHVKRVINWDEEGYPLSGNRADRGERPGAPALLKFMGSSIRGHMASEVVVEVDAQEVTLKSKSKDKRLNGKKKGSNSPNHRAPIGSVEVLVSNYEFRRDGPVAWGLDYQWLFETVGYPAADLSGPEFDAWSIFARSYDRESYESERALLLGGTNHTEGRPFPYIPSVDSVTLLRPLSDDDNPPVCAFGKTTLKIK